jgi:hypothetical protein
MRNSVLSLAHDTFVEIEDARRHDEFGRTPKIGDANADGRGHWPPVMSALITGGGLKMGQVVGSARCEPCPRR